MAQLHTPDFQHILNRLDDLIQAGNGKPRDQEGLRSIAVIALGMASDLNRIADALESLAKRHGAI